MSCYFQVGEQIVWNPSNGVAHLFVDQSMAISRLIGHESGVGAIIQDECQIEVDAFQRFVQLLVNTYQESNHTVLRALVRGYLGMSLALAARIGGRVEIAEADRGTWRTLMAENQAAMPV
ncbi:DUF6086 family protein [Polymorphospora rubra]|uniref:DUF6086 family protein n=1 Tax=Polymorphospora rubra TaxID=338584 RepID=UPI00340CE002